MKKTTNAIWNLVVTVSLFYYAGFFILLLLGVLRWTDTILPDNSIQHTVRSFFGNGMILFWIYLICVPLGLTGVLRIPKKQFIAMVAMVSVTVVLFLLSEVG